MYKQFGISNLKTALALYLLLKTVTSATIPTPDAFCADKAADIVFAVDSSSSVWKSDFVKELKFVQSVVGNLPIGKNQIHVGLVTFATDVQTQFGLTDYCSKKHVGTALEEENVKYHDGGTNTGGAIKHARETMFNARKNRDRANVNKVMVVLTDGYSLNLTNTSIEASISRSHGIKMIAVGIGKYLDGLELNSIANKPSPEVGKFVFRVDDFEALKSIVTDLSETTCRAIQTTATNSSQNDGVQTDNPHESEVKKYCGGKPADVQFVLDSSTSIGPQNFWKMLHFVTAVVDMFDVGTSATRVGVVTYSNKVHSAIPLNNKKDKASLQSRIRGLKFLRGGTHTGSALKYVRERSFSEQPSSRPHVARVVILLTDGQSADTALTKQEAKRLHHMGVNIFALGIGDLVDKTELKEMASEPKKNFVFEMDDFDALSSIKNTLAIKTCMAVDNETQMQKDQATNQCQSKDAMDVMFVFDEESLGVKKSMVLLETLVDVMSVINSIDIHSGIMMHSCENLLEIPLSSYRNKQDILYKSKASQSIGIPALLRKLRTQGFHKRNGGREDVKRVAFVIVDGELEDSRQAILESKRLRFGDKVEVYTVVIGNVDFDVATEMASQPVSEHVIAVPDFSGMLHMRTKILEQMCVW